MSVSKPPFKRLRVADVISYTQAIYNVATEEQRNHACNTCDNIETFLRTHTAFLYTLKKAGVVDIDSFLAYAQKRCVDAGEDMIDYLLGVRLFLAMSRPQKEQPDGFVANLEDRATRRIVHQWRKTNGF